ncbi:MAG: GGDEF domain-containing response regulator [Actinomycetota bacterium]
MTTEKVLVADDDADIRRFVEISLNREGYEVIIASDGEEALALAVEQKPSLVLLDVEMPNLDGFSVCRAMRADFRTATIPVIMLTARSLGADKVVGLTAGADDYMIKPFDPVELIARVKSTLRRVGEMISTSPLTGLPGNNRIETEIKSRLSTATPFALCYADIDDFKSFNDRYGFLRGDQAIVYTARMITGVVQREQPDGFVGHIGGDDFSVIIDPSNIERICMGIIGSFDAGVRSLYDPKDVEQGGFVVTNRQGMPIHHGLLSISIGVGVCDGDGGVADRSVVDRATEMKTQAKKLAGSQWLVDRRS